MMELKQRIMIGSKSTDVYDRIRKYLVDEKTALYIFGGGVMAKGVYTLLQANEIAPQGFLVDHVFFDDKVDNYPVDIIDASLFSPEEKICVVYAIANTIRAERLTYDYKYIDKIFFLSGVTEKNGQLIDENSFLNSYKDYDRLWHNLSDEKSRKCFTHFLNANIQKDVTHLFSCRDCLVEYFNNDVFQVKNDKLFVDVGAYTGDTIASYLLHCPNANIIAFEGDGYLCQQIRRSFPNMIDLGKIDLRECVLWDCCTNVVFTSADASASGGKNVIDIAKDSSGVVTTTLDSELSNRNKRIDTIKINLVGTKKILDGAKQIINEDHPKIVIKLWYEPETIIDITRFLFHEQYKVFLRFINLSTDGMIIVGI